MFRTKIIVIYEIFFNVKKILILRLKLRLFLSQLKYRDPNALLRGLTYNKLEEAILFFKPESFRFPMLTVFFMRGRGGGLWVGGGLGVSGEGIPVHGIRP